MIQKGYITEVLEGGKKAKVQTFQGDVLDNVLLLHPYGESSNPSIDDYSLILLFFSLGSKSAAFGIPYNLPLQPTLESGEKVIGNLSIGNKITFKADNSIEVIAEILSVTATTSTTSGTFDATGSINTADFFKVDGTKVVGNQGAAIANPAGGATIDAEARTAIGLILAALRTHGLITT